MYCEKKSKLNLQTQRHVDHLLILDMVYTNYFQQHRCIKHCHKDHMVKQLEHRTLVKLHRGRIYKAI